MENQEIKKSGTYIITPEMAQTLFDKSIGNRNLNSNFISRLSGFIKEGKWMNNGQPIIISSDGRLLDGHNRLQAIARAGIPVEMEVVTGIDRNVFPTIDSGKARNAADGLAILKYEYPALLASTVSNIIAFQRNSWTNDKLTYTSKLASFGARRLITVEDLHRFIEENNYRLYYVGYDRTGPHNFGKMSKWLVNFIHYQFSQINPEEANQFMFLYKTLDKLEYEHPISLVRAKLDKIFNDRLRKSSDKEIIIYMFRAWNDWRNGNRGKIRLVTANCIIPELK